MHIQTHLMAGWCWGNCFNLNPRQRLITMLAATAADLDGLGMLVSTELYWDWHHKLMHNIFAGIALAVIGSAFAGKKLKMFVVLFAIFHLHLIMDLFGSGEGWGFYYFWPISDYLVITDYAWPFYSWQNITTAGLLFSWIVWLVIKSKRTPLEAIMPSLDRQLVKLADNAVATIRNGLQTKTKKQESSLPQPLRDTV